MNDPLLGIVLGDAYSIVERIGAGGMGTVYRAEQVALGRTVAVKIVHPMLLRDAAALERFETEARAASRLNHPNSVSIYDFGRAPDGRPYFVMEFVQGCDLATVLEQERLVARPRVARIVLGILEALVQAHEQGVIHRDLKPDNVLLTMRRDGVEQVKVVDFGLAQVLGTRRATQPGVLVGTPGYMSPEQIAGEPLDGRSDVYSVGVILHELLTGQTLFPGASVAAVVLRQLRYPAPDPRTVAPPEIVPGSLAEIALRALALNRDERYASAAAMAAELEDALRDLEGRPSWPDDAPESEIPATTAPSLDETIAAVGPDERRLLQAAAVLGGRAPSAAVRAVAGVPGSSGLRVLATGGLAALHGGLVVLDEAVQRLVEASVPVEAARELHDRAVAWYATHRAPIAVRAEHACRGSDALVALLLLDQWARELGEANADTFQVLLRGLDLARRELARTGDEPFLAAFLGFSARLATVLQRNNRSREASGVLREALELAPPSSRHRLTLFRLLEGIERRAG